MSSFYLRLHVTKCTDKIFMLSSLLAFRFSTNNFWNEKELSSFIIFLIERILHNEGIQSFDLWVLLLKPHRNDLTVYRTLTHLMSLQKPLLNIPLNISIFNKRQTKH